MPIYLRNKEPREDMKDSETYRERMRELQKKESNWEKDFLFARLLCLSHALTSAS